MYMYPPAPTPDPSLESAEAPLSSPGKGPRKGRPVHNHVMVQKLQLWNYIDIKLCPVGHDHTYRFTGISVEMNNNFFFFFSFFFLFIYYLFIYLFFFKIILYT